MSVCLNYKVWTTCRLYRANQVFSCREEQDEADENISETKIQEIVEHYIADHDDIEGQADDKLSREERQHTGRVLLDSF